MKHYYFMNLVFFVSLSFISCEKNYTKDIQLENEIVESFIWEYFTQYNDTIYDTNGKVIKIEYSNPTDFVFVSESHPNANWYDTSCESSSSKVTKHMKRDYINRNKEILKFDSIKNFPKKIIYVNNETLNNNIDWAEDFIELGYVPVISISRPGISKNKKEAFFYLENFKLRLWSGAGYCLLMENTNNKWVIKEKELVVLIN